MAHRYSDFETLHKALLTENPQLQLPPLPPKADAEEGEVVVGGGWLLVVFVLMPGCNACVFLAWKQYGRT